MIKPPFTLLILKDSHRPFTMRITKRLIIFLFIAIFVFSGIVIYGISGYVIKKSLYLTQSNIENSSKNVEYIIVEDEKGANSESNNITEPDVKDLSIQKLNDGRIEISFTFEKIPDNNELFVWLILNPESEEAGETLIYPRSPIFRGLPVDYRNGIFYNPSSNKYIKATFSGPIIGVDFKKFRVLAYLLEGNTIVDKTFNIQQNIRM